MQNKFKKTIKENKKDFIKFVVFFILIIGLSYLTIKLIPFIISLKDAEVRIALENYIHSKGAYGVLILLGIQVLQVIVAFIPGEVVEVLAGLLYGTFFGYLICTIGMLIGTVIIYYSVKFLGLSFLKKFFNDDKLSKYKFLQDTKKVEILTFILFFIPGTPKDLLTYFMPLTKIKPSTLFVIVTVARIPSIVSSTFAGSSLGQGKILQTVLIFLLIGFTGILGIKFNDVIIEKLTRGKAKIKEKFKHK